MCQRRVDSEEENHCLMQQHMFDMKYPIPSSLLTSDLAISLPPCPHFTRYVKNMGKAPDLCPNGMDVAKLTHKKVLQTLENGIRFGKWILLENIGEVIGAAQHPAPSFRSICFP